MILANAAFTSNNVRPNSGPSATLTFIGAHQLDRVNAYNGGLTPAVVTLTCAGHLPVTATVASHQQSTINWNATCSSVSFSGTNVSYDNLVVH